MRFKSSSFWIVLVLILGFSSAAFPASLEDKALGQIDADKPVEVHGDSVEYFHEQHKVVGTGNVSIDYEGSRLTADKITVYLDQKNAVAEGHVTLTQKGSVFKGDRAEYNYKTKVGNVTGMDAQIAPSYYGKARLIEKVSDTHYRAVDSYITTCCGDSPFYKIQAHQVDIYPEKKVVVRNAVLFIKNVPVLFIPYYVQYFIDFERFPVQLVPGKTPEWGLFLLSKWRYHLAEEPTFQSKGNVLLDWREKRGWGYGAENFYRGERIGRGSLKAYYTMDEQAPADAENKRYRMQWRHQSKLSQDTTLTTELNGLSDASFLKDYFFREEYERAAFPDNYVSVITAKPGYTLSFLDRERLDTFFTVVERSPEVRFDTHNRALGQTPFYLREEIQFSNLQKKYANSDAELHATRLDTNHTLTYAGRAGALSITPHVGTRQTFYSRGIASDERLLRGTFDAGVDLNIRFSKVYNVYVKAFGLDYNQIRHVFSPSAGYHFRPNPTVLRTQLQPFDALDAIDKENFVRFSFENKLQTRYHNTPKTLATRDLARVIPSFDMNYDSHRVDSVGITSEFRPYTWLGLSADATYDTRSRDVNRADFDVSVTRHNFSVSLGQSYLRDESSQTTSAIRFKPSSDLEVKLYERYEFEEQELKEFELTFSKYFECVIVDFTYNHRDGDSFYIVLRLKAFPQASFGLSQTYNRPKTTASRTWL